jgi:threonine dehydrogenase-like Zn-dependent dehydrogenase
LADWVREADLVLETTGDPAAPFHLSSVMAPNAVMVLLSTSPKRSGQSLEVGALVHGLVQRNQAVVGCAASGRRHLERAVEVLQELNKRFRGLPQRLITHRYPLAQFRTALTEVPSDGIKAVIQL